MTLQRNSSPNPLPLFETPLLVTSTAISGNDRFESRKVTFFEGTEERNRVNAQSVCKHLEVEPIGVSTLSFKGWNNRQDPFLLSWTGIEKYF